MTADASRGEPCLLLRPFGAKVESTVRSALRVLSVTLDNENQELTKQIRFHVGIFHILELFVHLLS